MKRALPFVIIVSVMVGALWAGWYSKRSTVSTPRTLPSATTPLNPPSGATKLGATPPHELGSPDAPVMVEQFGDFECPPCASLHPVLKAMKAEFGSRLVIVFRELPLINLHPRAMDAAQAAEAAGLQGKFWEMHDLLYENQAAWHGASDAVAIFEQYATKLNLDLEQFKRQRGSEAVKQRIFLDQERARWIGVNSTPTVFLNGREVPLDSLGTEKLQALIRAAL